MAAEDGLDTPPLVPRGGYSTGEGTPPLEPPRPRARWPWGVVLLASVTLFVALLVLAPRDELLGQPADPGRGGAHAFFQFQPDDPSEPVAWDPCEPVRYEVNPDGGPDDAVGFVQEAVEVVAGITGLAFTYGGTTERRPELDEELRAFARPPVLIAFADAEEVGDLEGRVAGVGGAVAVGVGRDGLRRYVTGSVVLDADLVDDLDDAPNGRAQLRAVLLHELGHVVGLDHVEDPTELMYGESTQRLDFGPGDIEGLVRLGRGTCL